MIYIRNTVMHEKTGKSSPVVQTVKLNCYKLLTGKMTQATRRLDVPEICYNGDKTILEYVFPDHTRYLMRSKTKVVDFIPETVNGSTEVRCIRNLPCTCYFKFICKPFFNQNLKTK